MKNTLTPAIDWIEAEACMALLDIDKDPTTTCPICIHRLRRLLGLPCRTILSPGELRSFLEFREHRY